MVDDFHKEDEVAHEQIEKTGRRGFLLKSSLALAGGAAVTWQTWEHRQKILSALSRATASQDHPESTPKKKRSGVPDLPSVRDYQTYLAQDELPYLSPNEIIRPHFKYRSGVCSGVPPKHLWKNMLRTARVANEIRFRLGVPLHTVVSAYRSPEYNGRCPGASKYSQHLKNRALDLIYSCPPKHAFDIAVKLRDEGLFKGGIGLYSTFIHIDTRGRNATWGV